MVGPLPRLGDADPLLPEGELPRAEPPGPGEERRSLDRALRSADARRSGWRQGSFPVARQGSFDDDLFS